MKTKILICSLDIAGVIHCELFFQNGQPNLMTYRFGTFAVAKSSKRTKIFGQTTHVMTSSSRTAHLVIRFFDRTGRFALVGTSTIKVK
jgi:hypothetical protein